MRRHLWVIAVVVIAMVTSVLIWTPGPKAVVTNTGTTAMRNVRVEVTGRAYPIGDLPPGESRSLRVRPTGESHIVLRYADTNGAAQAVRVDCYFESGYSGRISVDVADGKVSRVDARIRLTPW
jgi:hypothetical protein